LLYFVAFIRWVFNRSSPTDKEVVGVTVRFRAPLQQSSLKFVVNLQLGGYL
jgi:hypothetical protein